MVRPHGRVKVKICGITNRTDARHAVKAGCSALGFIFYKKSPRYVLPSRARAIIAGLPKRILKVGVFVNASEKRIRSIARSCGLTALQLHGVESPSFCGRLKGFRVIKAFRVKGALDPAVIRPYATWAYLLDAYDPDIAGGTGRCFDWRKARALAQKGRLLILSGGLTAENVRRAIRIAHPDWVDVSSGVEAEPGVKDVAKVVRFMKEARR